MPTRLAVSLVGNRAVPTSNDERWRYGDGISGKYLNNQGVFDQMTII